MKQKKQLEELDNQHDQKNKKIKEDELLEIHKAVAQAWHSHFTNARVATSEFDARRRNFRNCPSRFRLEALQVVKTDNDKEAETATWDFNETLWDSYEIVAVSKRLETTLRMEYGFDEFHRIDGNRRVFKKRRESKNSLRNLFNMVSSRRSEDVSYQQSS